MFWDLPGKQLNSGCLFNIFIFNSVTRQFKKCISKTPQKEAAVSYHFLCCLGGSSVAKFVQTCDSEKSLGRGSIPNTGWQRCETGSKRTVTCSLRPPEKGEFLNSFVSKQDCLRETADSTFCFLCNTCSSTYLAKVWVKKRVTLIKSK